MAVPAVAEISVRAARPDEVDRLAALELRAWRSALASIETGVPTTPELWRRTLAERVADTEAFVDVALLDGLPAGVASSGPSREPTGLGELYTLYVEPSMWRRGVATVLVGAAARHLARAGHRRMLVWTTAANVPARATWEALGLRLTSADDRDRDGGPEEVCYALDLAQSGAGAEPAT
jgi:GNAT superfamily N-acetyltransferase